MQKVTNIKKLFIILVYFIYCIYYIEDMKTSANVVVKQTNSRGGVYIFLILLIALLLLYVIFRSKQFKDIGVNIPIICLVGWGGVVDVYNETALWSAAVRLGLLVLWVLVTFFISDIVKDEKSYQLVLFFEIIIWFITIYYSVESFFNYANYAGDNTSNVLNIAYNILVLIPWLLQIKNKYLKVGGLLISSSFIVLSMKRGAILALLLMMVIYCYTIFKNNKINRVKFFQAVLIALVFIVVIFVLVDRFTNHYLSSRFSMEELLVGSTRNEIYRVALKDIENRSFIAFMIGKGSGASLLELGSGVHNEILEILFSYGLIGLLLYLWMIIKGIKSIIKQLKCKDHSSTYYAMTMGYIVFVGLVGTALFAHYTFHIMAMLGLSCEYLKNENKAQL